MIAAGFVDFEITWRAEVYAGAPQASSAAQFGTLGINFRARKARDETEWANAVATLMCEL
ncbi:MAG TPA: hypothetical protein DGB72_06785 [Gemmatimonadetes bacterium]|nr:hypothetical protein [Gemmatimonadota bacterium]